MNAPLRTVQFASDFVEKIATRDADGNRLSIDWGQPDEHGYWTPTITVHYDDNLRRATVERTVILMENEGVVTWGDDRHRQRFLDAEADR